MRDIVIATSLLVAVVTIHILASRSANPWLRAGALRLYYFPILYVAYAGGLFPGILAGSVAAIFHYAVMTWVSIDVRGGPDLLAEHRLELIFFVVTAALVGALKDHEHHERERSTDLANLFSSYVSPTVLQQLLDRQVPLNGTALEATVLFSDLRGFTTIAERMTPKEVLSLLNTHFGAMTEVLLAHGAYIDKFLGDGIMAVFGVPLPQPNSAIGAVRSAIAMHHRMTALNQRGAFGHRKLVTGVGIHVGELVAGNVGGIMRREYTVIGDTVNTAARIEALNRAYGSHVLVSETVQKAVRSADDLLLREVDAVRVKGRARPIVLYEVYNCCNEEEIARKNETAAEFTAGLQFYRACEWSRAEDCFRSVLARYPDDAITRMYCERIAFLRHNCPANWDGVFDIVNK